MDDASHPPAREDEGTVSGRGVAGPAILGFSNGPQSLFGDGSGYIAVIMVLTATL